MTERFIADLKEDREGHIISPPKLSALFVKVVARLLHTLRVSQLETDNVLGDAVQILHRDPSF